VKTAPPQRAEAPAADGYDIEMPPAPPHNVIVPDLPSALSREQAAVQQAALEWSILAPIIIRSPEDVKSRVKWSADLTPFIHQYENLYTFCRRLPVSLIADDVGLGKTVSAGLILSELITRQRVRRTLVLCPKILCHQWQSELQAKFGIDAHACSGTNDLKAAIRGRHSVVITTNHSALQVLPTLSNDVFEMLILDEAHKLRNLHGTNAPPQIAIRIRNALQSRLFNFVVMLTATPLHNRLWDIYSLIDLLALGRNHANPFGDPDRFRARFIDERHHGDRVIQKGREAEFRGIVRDYMVRTRRLDAKLPFPSRLVENTELALPADEAKLFEYVGSILGQLGPLEQASLAKALLSSPQALALQMENMSRTRPQFSAAAAKIRQFADQMGATAKLQRLARIVEELKAAGGNSWRLLVFTERTETQRAIGEWLMEKDVRLGYVRGGAAAANQKAIEAFQADPPGINCIISTDAGSEGVNLQACSYLVNFDLPWNPMIVEQRIGRIQRLSSKYENVVVSNLVLKHPADAHVVGLLMQKLAAIANAVDDIESVLEDINQGADGEGQRFENTVRDLVVKALMKQDVSEAVAQIQDNIRLAEAKKREQEEELDDIFGPKNGAVNKDIRPPDLAYPDPSLEANDFVLAAKRLEGRVEKAAGETWIHRPEAGLPEQFSFSREVAEASAGVFGRRIEHYDAGTPPFQRLVGRWATDHHEVEDRTCAQPEALLALLRELLAPRKHVTVTDTTVVGRRHSLDATVLVRAQAANGVDRYEKLIRIGGPANIFDEQYPVKRTPIKRQELPEDVQAVVRGTVERDGDIAKFLEYYRRKHDQEAEKAAGDRTRLSRLAANYTPKLESKIVSASGVQFAKLDVEVAYSIRGEGSYVSRFSLDTRQHAFTAEPEWKTCEVSGHTVPADAIASCEVSGTEACQHFMKVSGVSGKHMLTEHSLTCGVTGVALLPVEAGESDVSGITVDLRLLKKSKMSDRRGIESEMVHCAFTDSHVLSDEIVVSDVSGKPARKDKVIALEDGRVAHPSELQRCAITGTVLPSAELGQSDLTGKFVLKSLLIPSSVPPHRLGLESEFLVCAVSGQSALVDEVVISSVSGKPCLPECAAKSEQSGRIALPEELLTCIVTGRKLLPDEVVISAVSGAPIESGHEFRSAVSGRIGTPSEKVTCELTGDTVLEDEVVVSELSGKSFRQDEVIRVGDGRLCHPSEARSCAASGTLIPLADGDISAISGAWVDRRLLVASEKPPHRLGLESETILCPLTGLRLLVDEVATSVSGQVGNRELLTRSEITGKEAFPHELVTCEASGKRALPEEMEVCAVSGKRVNPSLLVASPVSGRKALDSECVACEATGALVLPDELAESKLSGKRFRQDEAVSLRGNRVAHRTEARQCEISGEIIGQSEGEQSVISGKWVDKKILVQSDKTGRRGLPSERRQCEITGVYLLQDEVGVSTTGKVGDRELLTKSELTGRPAFPVELVICEASGRKGLPDEMASSDVSGRVVDPTLLVQSATSSRRGLREECVTCEVTGVVVLSDEVVISDVSGKKVAGDHTLVDDEGHRGHKSEFARCSRTKRLLPRSRVRPSDVSGVYVDEDLLVASEKTLTRRGLPDETVTCSVTGKRLLADEAERSELSGRIGDKDLLLVSPKLKKRVFASELVTCSYTGQQLLPEEMETSQYSGSRSAPEAMLPSSVSGRRGLPSEFGTCDFTNARCLLDELAKSDISGRMYRIDQEALHADGRRGHVSEFRICSHSSRVLLPTDGAVSDVSGRWAAREHLVTSELAPHRHGLASESVRCAVTGKLLLEDEVERSEISGRRGDRGKLVQSPVSHKWGFADEMVWCEESDHWFTTDEIGECCITGKRVDKRRLGRSEASGKMAMKTLLVPCAASGQRVLPQELKKCSRTNALVLPNYLGRCVATNSWVLKKHLVLCHLPEGLITDDAAYRVRSASSGRICAKQFAKRCYWTGKTLLPDEGGVCSVTRLWFSQAWLRDGTFTLIHDAVSSHEGDAWRTCDDMTDWLSPLFAAIGAIRTVVAMKSPDGPRELVVAELVRWPWQPVRRVVALVLPQHRKCLGQAALFTAQGSEWARKDIVAK
jgi:superfamily II DNA or RNA helicase